MHSNIAETTEPFILLPHIFCSAIILATCTTLSELCAQLGRKKWRLSGTKRSRLMCTEKASARALIRRLPATVLPWNHTLKFCTSAFTKVDINAHKCIFKIQHAKPSTQASDIRKVLQIDTVFVRLGHVDQLWTGRQPVCFDGQRLLLRRHHGAGASPHWRAVIGCVVVSRGATQFDGHVWRQHHMRRAGSGWVSE